MKIIVSPGSVVNLNSFFKRFIVEMEALDNEVVSPRLLHIADADLFHLHFPEFKISVNKNWLKAFLVGSAMLLFILGIRLRGKPVVWMVHDVRPLKKYNPRLCNAYMFCVRKMMSGYIFLSQSSRTEFERLYPEERTKPMLNVMHPPYPIRLLNSDEKKAVREKLSVKPDEFLIGYLGDIRDYKNSDVLRYIPEQLDDGRNVVLLVAGKADDDAKAFEQNLSKRRHIYINRRITDEEMESFTQSVDVTLLPYSWGWNSGALFLALSGHQKALTSDLSIFREMQNYFGPGWITTFALAATDKKAEMKRAVETVAKTTCAAEDIEKLSGQLGDLSYPRMAKRIQDFYVSLAPERNMMQSVSTK